MDLGLTDKVADRHRLEPRARAGERPGARGRGLPRLPLRARRGTAGRGRARGRGGGQAPEHGRRPCRPTCRPRTASSSSSSGPSRRSAASTSSSTTSAGPAGADLLDTSDAEWQAAFDETLFPAIRASRLAVPHMRQRGGGAIVMIASIYGREAGGRMTYNAVKAAEISLAKSLAQQLAPLNIRVNSVAPGLDPVSRRLLAPAPAGRSRRDRRVHHAASCRSAASAVPTKSAPSSPSSPPRAPAGSAARASPSTAVRGGRTSDGIQPSQTFSCSAVSSELSQLSRSTRIWKPLAD